MYALPDCYDSVKESPQLLRSHYIKRSDSASMAWCLVDLSDVIRRGRRF